MMKTVLLGVVLAACGGSPQPPAQDPVVANSVPKVPPDAAIDAPLKSVASVMAKMTDFRDEMCTCKDNACVDRLARAARR